MRDRTQIFMILMIGQD